MNILITGIGGATPRAIARRVREIFPEANITATDLNAKATGFYLKGLVDSYYIVPSCSQERYWEVMEGIINKHTIDLAFIQPEKEVIEWGNYFDNHGKFLCPTLIPPSRLSKSLMNKANMSDILEGSDYIPKTIRITHSNTHLSRIESEIGYPCWIRATEGSGGYGSLKINNRGNLESWLLIHKEIQEFTISEFLPGRHLANQMLYIDGVCIKNAGLECVEYVMANVAPSKVTGNTSYGRFINNSTLLSFCEECVDYICDKLNVKPHGVLSFDLKEDINGKLKVTEVNIRHMAYTETMARAGFDLISDTINLILGKSKLITNRGYYNFEKNYIFLRDVDIEPLLLVEEDLLEAKKFTL